MIKKIRNLIFDKNFLYPFITIIFLGLIILLISDNYYKSSAKIISYKSGANPNSFSSFASNLMGSEVSDEGKVVHNPDVMIGILKSYTFQVSILDAIVDEGAYKNKSIREVYLDVYNIKLKKNEKDLDFKIIKKFKKHFSVKKDRLTSIIDLSMETVDRDLSQFILNEILKSLEKEVIQFATKITRDKLEFFELRINEVIQNLEEAENNLVEYELKNQARSRVITLEIQRLNRNVVLYSNSLGQLRVNKEDLLLQLVEDSSKIFQIVEPTYPYLKSKPHRTNGMLITIINSFILSTAFAYFKRKRFNI